MNYLTKSVQAIGQIVGLVMGAGFATQADETLKAHTYLGTF